MGFWSNAFKLPQPAALTQEDYELISKAAKKIREKQMADIAALAIEASRPVHGLGAQALVFLKPFLTTIFGEEKAKKFIELMENKKAVDFFLNALNGEK